MLQRPGRWGALVAERAADAGRWHARCAGRLLPATRSHLLAASCQQLVPTVCGRSRRGSGRRRLLKQERNSTDSGGQKAAPLWRWTGSSASASRVWCTRVGISDQQRVTSNQRPAISNRPTHVLDPRPSMLRQRTQRGCCWARRAGACRRPRTSCVHWRQAGLHRKQTRWRCAGVLPHDADAHWREAGGRDSWRWREHGSPAARVHPQGHTPRRKTEAVHAVPPPAECLRQRLGSVLRAACSRTANAPPHA